MQIPPGNRVAQVLVPGVWSIEPSHPPSSAEGSHRNPWALVVSFGFPSPTSLKFSHLLRLAAASKKVLSERQYNQEFNASFETASGRIYEDYSADNYTDRLIQPHEQLLWMHDQNYTPLSSAIGVRDGDNLYLLDEIVLTSAVSRQSAMEFVERYKDHKNRKVLIYGDPAGKAGEKHGHPSDYTEIEDVLKQSGWTYERRVKPAHPAIKDRQNAVRAKIKTASGSVSVFVNKNTAEWCHKGLATVQLQKGSTFQEDQKNDYQHITTAIGYMIDYEWPINNVAFDLNIRFR